MIFLDTNHLSILRYRGSLKADRIISHLDANPDEEICATIISVEESFRGWLASIAKEADPLRQCSSYRELGELFTFYSGFRIVLFDEVAAEKFKELKQQKIRIGTMDLKIAAMTLVHDARLITANRRDFEKVPGLWFENWMD